MLLRAAIGHRESVAAAALRRGPEYLAEQRYSATPGVEQCLLGIKHSVA